MKNREWVSLTLAMVLSAVTAAAQPPPPQEASAIPPAQSAPAVPTDLPPGAAEVVRLSEAGTSEEVMVSFVHHSTSRFNLSADQILYLRDIGFSSPVISAMLSRDHELQNQPQPYIYNQRLYRPVNPSTVAPQPAPVAPPESPALTTPPVAAPPAYVSSPPAEVSYFYDDLSPYGAWVELDGIGWCWQPRVVVVNHAWRPYCDGGYWAYTDAGWYWQSGYSWGWAPFHYGRWQLHPRCGWVWLPDRVWGPAWVVWRSEADHCGWAPLPPHALFETGIGWRFNGVRVALDFDFGLRPDHFTFIALKDFNNRDLGHRRMAPAEVTRIYNHTTIVNNYVGNNKTIVNQGIRVDRVAAATHSQIHSVPIRDVPAAHAGTSGGPPNSRPGAAVYRTQLSAPAHRTPMVAQKIDDRHPVVQHPPIVAAKSDQRPPPANRPSLGNNPPRGSQVGVRGNPQQPSAQNTPSRQDNSPRQPYQPAPSQSSPSNTRTSNAPAANNGKPSNPPRTSNAPQAGSQQSVRPSGDTHSSAQYYPKSYRQAAEIHALPPLNPRADPPVSRLDRPARP